MNERYIKWYTPWLSREFEMQSGPFDISSFFDSYHGDDIYFNSPCEYLPNTTAPWKCNHVSIIGTREWDNTRYESYRLSIL